MERRFEQEPQSPGYGRPIVGLPGAPPVRTRPWWKRLDPKLLGVAGGVALAGLLFLVLWDQPVRYQPGVLVEEAPLQEPVDDDVSAFTKDEYWIKPLATFSLRARVLSKERYRSGKESDLSPYDLALGWGKMSDQRVVDKLTFRQSGRWYYFRFGPDAGISESGALSHSANMHILPSTDRVFDVLDDIRTGDIIQLQGYLVQVSDEKVAWTWKSSMSRTDRGNHSCEVIWVEELSIVTAEYPVE